MPVTFRTVKQFQPNDESLGTPPKIGITMGDPAGIGPEIILKALSLQGVKKSCRPIIVGDAAFLRKTAEKLALEINLLEVKKQRDIPENEKSILIYDIDNLKDDFPLGQESKVAGRACGEYIETAIDLWKTGKVDAITTAPINKKSLEMGGYNYHGHTEFLAYLTNTKEFAMSFFADKLCVVLLSTHTPLQNAINLVKKNNLIELIKFTDRKLSQLMNKDIKIAVAGLNPHASEFGMFGDEEAVEIVPAVSECRDRYGIDVLGPFSPDTVFLRGFKGDFDAVVSCYHDQATIAVKCLSFGASVNVTLGLPVVRTSVDHGTAFDIVGKKKADCSSLKAAIKLASKLVKINNLSLEAL